MAKRSVHIETIHTPAHYSQEELDHACLIAAYLNRGKLVLLKPPEDKQ